jgi:hypothetical protein
MTVPSGRNITKGGIWFVPLYNPLCTPEKISEFMKGKRIAGILPDGPPRFNSRTKL